MLATTGSDLMTKLQQAKQEFAALARVKPRVPEYYRARIAIRRASDALKEAGVKPCEKCHGTKTVAVPVAPIVKRCDWCDGSGWDEDPRWNREQVCWKCEGARVTVQPQYSYVECWECDGAGVVTP